MDTREIRGLCPHWRLDCACCEAGRAKVAEMQAQRDTERMMREERDRLLAVAHEQLDGARAEVERLREWLYLIGQLADVNADNRGWMVRQALDGLVPISRQAMGLPDPR